MDIKREVLTHLSKALEFARSCEQEAPWLVENVAKHVWNHHLGITTVVLSMEPEEQQKKIKIKKKKGEEEEEDNEPGRDKLLPELVQLFESLLEALLAIGSTDHNLLCNLTRVLARRLEIVGDFSTAVATCQNEELLKLFKVFGRRCLFEKLC